MKKSKERENIKNFIERHLPIGYRAEKARTAFLTSLICPVIFSLTFLVNYSREKENLYRYIAGGFRKELILSDELFFPAILYSPQPSSRDRWIVALP